MSTPKEQRESIQHAVEAAERRLKELESKPLLSRAEVFERDMTIYCIKQGNKILGKEPIK